MVEETIISEIVNITSNISPSLASQLETLIIILQAVGIAIILYVAYLLLSLYINWKRMKLLKQIDERTKLLVKSVPQKKTKRKKKF